MRTTDVLVIGAGVVGAACAYYAAKAGLAVTVVDRGAVAGGTTGAGEGNLLVSDKEPGSELALALLSTRLWRELAAEFGAVGGGPLPGRRKEHIFEYEHNIRLDTPAGLVVVEVAVSGGAATSVTFRNVPSFVHALDQSVRVAGLGEVTYALAFGGNFYAILPIESVGLPFDRARKPEILDAGLAIMDAINEQNRPVHPENPDIAVCHHVQLVAPGSDSRLSRHAMAIHPGWFDRSPCGTGTSARLAQLHARGELKIGDEFVNESFIGTRFIGRAVAETTVAGRPAIIPTITGRAWVTGTAQYSLDPEDPFPGGFLL